MDLSGKVILVTGAARGIGREYILSLGQAGASMVAADINDCDETLALAKQSGVNAIGVALDVTQVDSANAMVQAAIDQYGRVDGLINNAALYGALAGGRFDAIEEQQWDVAMAVNVKGIWNCCKAAVPEMRKVGGGSIVNIGSLAAAYGMPYALHYTTSKAAVGGLTRGLARELGRDAIRVNAIAPSAVQTDGTDEFFANKRDVVLDTVRKGQAIPTTLNPSDIVGTANWLLSDASKFITGQTIAVDGGTIM